MDRRDFLGKMSLAASGVMVLPPLAWSVPADRVRPVKGKLLNAYYFRAHMYTLVPHQVREDLQFMADLGTDAISVAILEQDLFAAVENVSIIANEAERLGISLFIVPSRWGGILAGAPKVPSIFSAQHPHTWVLDSDGNFVKSKWSGVMSSFHHPDTRNFFKEHIDKCLSLWPVKGIIWDEPKLYTIIDHSAAAMQALDGSTDLKDHQQAFSDFFSELNAHIKSKAPEVLTSLFVYANLGDDVVQSGAQITHLDYYGCDGRPWRNEDGGEQEQANKVLLGVGERFLTAARAEGKGGFWLIENHNMSAGSNALMERRLEEVINHQPEQLAYYYYPRNVDKPDENMDIIGRHLKKYKA